MKDKFNYFKNLPNLMNKELKYTIIIFLAIIIIGWFLRSPISEEEKQEHESYKEYEMLKERDNFPSVDKLHWTHMPLTWSLINPDDCGKIQTKKIYDALEIIENSTDGMVRFAKSNNPDLNTKVDIRFICIDREKLREKENITITCINLTYDYRKERISPYDELIVNKFTQRSEGTSIITINNTLTIWQVCYSNLTDVNLDITNLYQTGESRPIIQGDLIINSTIYTLKSTDNYRICASFPATEIHEILHALGFDHNVDDFMADKIMEDWLAPENYDITHDIMFPYSLTECTDTIKFDKKYVSCLKYIYSNGEQGNCVGVNFLGTYEECNGGYCPEGYSCCDGECLMCEEGYYLANDCYCYPIY